MAEIARIMMEIVTTASRYAADRVIPPITQQFYNLS